MADELYSLPVWYKGRRYRSKTEAMYGVLFDELGIKFDHETQGFDANGTWYLPDFVLFPALGTLWAEVKGSWEQDPAGIERWRKFSLWRPLPSRSTLLVGWPSLTERILVMGGDSSGKDPSQPPWEDDTLSWRPCPSGHHFDLVWAGQFRSKFAEDGCPYADQEGRGQDRLERAIGTARGYQFDLKPPTGEAA